MAAPPVKQKRPEQRLDKADIQGLVVRGYGALHHARFLLLKVDQAERARAYLQDLCARIDTAESNTGKHAFQIAFTAPGLVALEVPASTRVTFSREFLEGMGDPVRAEALGDRHANDPSKWEWGPDVHALLMVYASDAILLDILVAAEIVSFTGGFTAIHKETRTLPHHKEHFGWRDGLSLPKVEGVSAEAHKQQQTWTKPPIHAGEFVLGYLNEYDCYTESPTAEFLDDPNNHLPLTRDSGRKDVGKNGTYLVYREMTQHVTDMWSYLARESREPGADPTARAVALGAKLIGRWPSGAPLMTSHDRDRPDRASDNRFLYSKDPVGLTCPIGAHIRRANPRDALAADRDETDSTIMVRKHQMIRRGRPFGEPVSPTLDPAAMIAAGEDDVRRGLHFICLVGHLSRQFEFVQRAWINSANFGALYKDGDPIAAARRPPGDENPNDEFTCPAAPLRRKYKAMPQFTTLVGGAYFFLPGLRALRFIAQSP